MYKPRIPPDAGGGRRPQDGLIPERGGQYIWPKLNQETNPGGARWCEQHNRLECTHAARSKADKICHMSVLRGRDHCRTHPGKAGKMKAALMGEAQITAWSAVTQDGKVKPGVHVEPGQAVLAMLQMAWFRAGAYAELLRQQVTKEAAKQQAIEAAVVDEDGAPIGQELGVSGLIGHKLSATNSGEIYATSEEVRALVQLEASERDRIVAYAEKAHKMGISDRMTSLAEQWGDVTAGRVVAMLDELELTPAQQSKVSMLVQKHLSSIDMTGIGQ